VLIIVNFFLEYAVNYIDSTSYCDLLVIKYLEIIHDITKHYTISATKPTNSGGNREGDFVISF
jgi:hypothetical protein